MIPGQTLRESSYEEYERNFRGKQTNIQVNTYPLNTHTRGEVAIKESEGSVQVVGLVSDADVVLGINGRQGVAEESWLQRKEHSGDIT